MEQNSRKGDKSSLSWPTIQRLTEYLIILEQFLESGREIVSSFELASVYSNTPSQVRQDIFRLPDTGRSGQGYKIEHLIAAIRHVLCLDCDTKLIIAGCGRVGMAVAEHVSFKDYGMSLVGLFDRNPAVIGAMLGDGLIVQDSSLMAKFISEEKVRIAALCVPPVNAQSVTEVLVASGICGILNFTSKHLKVPDNVFVQNRQIVCTFMQLVYRCSKHGLVK